MQGFTEGCIVHYVLTEKDAAEINRRRFPNAGHVDTLWPMGAQAHVGNHVGVGQHFPMIIVKVTYAEPVKLEDELNVNGQVFLDGNDVLWTQAVKFDKDKEPGTFHWIELV